MKRPTAASRKKVTPENLAGLGADRLAALLAAAAQHRPELKRRLRMELAAEQGADHLLTELDKRLASLESSRSKVSWRQKPVVLRDLDELRALIAIRLAQFDPALALDRSWRFLDLAGRLGARVKDKDGELARVFDRAASDVGRLLQSSADPANDAAALAEALIRDPAAWRRRLPRVLEPASPELARAALVTLSGRDGAATAWMPLLRQLADAAGDVGAYRATFSEPAQRTPEVAAEIARRLLACGEVEAAGEVLRGADPSAPGSPRVEADAAFVWETAWIDYLDLSGQAEAAQACRWSSFERTLSAERLRAFVKILPDFDDVEAEERAIRHAAAHPDVRRALQFMMDWPALPAAAELVLARAQVAGAQLEPQAEAWAERLRARQPRAASVLFQIAARGALRRRDREANERLSKEAGALAGG